MQSVVWEPVPGIDFRCADIAFTYDPPRLTALMYFSRVKDLPERDLELQFSGVIGLRWLPESYGWIDNPFPPRPTPKCRGGTWAGWTFPLLTIHESSWLSAYQNLPGTQGRQHFSLVAMNDLLNVLALHDVGARWIQAGETGPP